jgi:transposase-like protein
MAMKELGRSGEKVPMSCSRPGEGSNVLVWTTESLNTSLRKVTKNRGYFLNDDAMLKLFYLALKNISKKLIMPFRD